MLRLWVALNVILQVAVDQVVLVLELQVSVLQTLADERCLHLMPPLEVAVPNSTAFCSGDIVQQRESKAQDQLQKLLHELHQGSLLVRCYASNSLVIHLKA